MEIFENKDFPRLFVFYKGIELSYKQFLRIIEKHKDKKESFWDLLAFISFDLGDLENNSNIQKHSFIIRIFGIISQKDIVMNEVLLVLAELDSNDEITKSIGGFLIVLLLLHCNKYLNEENLSKILSIIMDRIEERYFCPQWSVIICIEVLIVIYRHQFSFLINRIFSNMFSFICSIEYSKIDDEINHVFNIIREFSLKLNPKALSLLYYIADFNVSNVILSTFIDLGQVIIEELDECTKSKEFQDLLNEEGTSYVLYEYNISSIDEYDPCQITNTDENWDYISILSTKELELLGLIQPIMQISNKDVVSHFFEELIQFSRKYGMPNRLCFVILRLIKLYHGLPFTSDILFYLKNSYFVNIDSSIFQNYHQYLYFLRNSTFEIIIQSSQEIIKSLIIEAETRPFVMAEVFMRMHYKKSCINIIEILSNDVIVSIVHALSLLSNMENPKKESQRAFSTIFSVIHSMIDDNSVLIHCFSNSVFFSSFIRNIHSKPLENIVISVFSNYLSIVKADNPSLNEISMYISTYFIKEALNGGNSLQSITVLWGCLINSLSYRTEIVSYFSPIAFQVLSMTYQCFPKSIFLTFLNFLSLVLLHDDVIELGVMQIKELYDFVSFFKEETQTDAILAVLSSMIANTRAINPGAVFLIQRPQMLLLYLCFSGNNGITYLNRLCYESYFNCIQCHKGNIDLLLIEFILNYPQKFFFQGLEFYFDLSQDEVIDIIFPLIIQISMFYSSLPVIEKLVSIAIPRKSQSFTKFSQAALCSINHVMTQLSVNPKPLYSYTDKSIPLIHKIRDYNPISKGFTFVFWFIIDTHCSVQKSSPLLVFSITDGQNDFFSIFIQGITLFCSIVSEDGVSTVPLSSSLLTTIWTTGSVSLIPKDRITSHLYYCIGDDVHSLAVIRNPMLPNQELFFRIGGPYKEERIRSDFPFLMLGPFRIIKGYPTHSKVVDILRDFSLINEEFEDIYLGDTLIDDRTFIYPISSVMNDNGFQRSLIPFISFIDLLIPHSIDRIVDIIYKIPKFSLYQEIIDSLILMPPVILTYNLYLRFYSIYRNTNNSILLRSVLFSMDFWLKSTGLTINRVFQHWIQALVPENIQHLIVLVPFEQVLSKMELFLWFDPKYSSTNDLLFERASEIDVDSLRNNVNRILYMYCAHCFKPKWVMNILSSLITIKETRQVISLLELLCLICDYVDNKVYVISLLQNLLFKGDDSVFIMTIKTIHVFAKNDNKRGEIFSNILFQLTTYHQNKNMYGFLFELVDSIPEVCIIIAFVSLKLDKNYREKIIDILVRLTTISEISKQVSNIDKWYIWPALCVFDLDPDYVEISINFFFQVISINGNIKLIEELFVFIRSIGFPCYSLFVSKFLSKFFQNLVEESSVETILYFLHQCAFLDFFGINNNFNTNSQLKDFSKYKPESYNSINKLIKRKIDMNMYFYISINQEHSPLFQTQMLFLKKIKNSLKENTCFITIYELYKYLYHIPFKSIHKKLHILKKLNSFIPSFSNIMEISYLQNYYNVLSNLSHYIEKRESIICKITGLISADLVSLDPNCTQSIIESIVNNYKETELRAFNQNLLYYNEVSIWGFLFSHSWNYHIKRNFNSDGILLKNRLYRSKKNTNIAEKHQFSIIQSSVCQFNAILVKFCKLQNIVVSLSSSGIIIKKLNKKRDIGNKKIYEILYRKKSSLSLIEIFTHDNESYLIDLFPFGNEPLKSIMFKSGLVVTNTEVYLKCQIENISKCWYNREISNFQFINLLNRYSGRSLNDIKLYPLFPNIHSKTKSFDQTITINSSEWNSFLKYFDFEGGINENEKEYINEVVKKHLDFCIIVPIELYNSPESLYGMRLYPSLPECYQYVYSNRKMLESEEYSVDMSKWIDNVFGASPTLCFDEESYPIFPILSSPVGTKIKRKRNECHVSTIDLIPKYRIIKSSIFINPSVVQVSVLGKEGIIDFFINIEMNSYYSSFSSISGKQGFHILNNGNHFFKEEANLMTSSDNDITFLDNQGYISIQNSKGKSLSRFKISPLTPSSIFTCLKYKTCIIGTFEKKIIAFSSSNGKIRWVYETTNGIPLSLLVTKGWGFVFVLFSRSFILLSINGCMLYEYEFSYKISCFSSWTCSSGFDYIVFSNDHNEVYVLEPFGVRLSPVLFISSSPIVSLQYSPDHEAIIILSSDMRLTRIPYLS